MSRTDRLIGIGLGLLVGIVAVLLFVFLGGPSSIDDPSLDQPVSTEALPSQQAPPAGEGRP